MKKLGIIFIVIIIFSWPNVSRSAELLPDEPATGRDVSVHYQAVYSYNQALGIWKTAEDINEWVTRNFKYEKARSIKLSSNERAKNTEISIYKPSDFFEIKAGVCVDLARFGVETLRTIDPNSAPKYLMIEFVPMQVNGNIFKLHWLVSFERDGMKYFFCDSKRPSYIAGPYNSTQAFISEYEQYRGRKIISHRELESYKKQRKARSGKVRKESLKANAADAKGSAAD